ncbi:MFS transporter [Sphingomicrobium clamense]|uniref:MFS transporter n=1 Tax=Sphingomicrobium clamense TaxID=2851013 RepID=A0ABS6V4Z2_9SPHN|nr:MFS transporter [Sphingomicrobium sp. B8]MBW0144609.1 MFS transporter [Sphingomicrobium sp. B8]
MASTLSLIGKRRFGPLFATLFCGAFNDNLYRTSMVLIVIYGIYADPGQEATFSAVAGGLFILPFFLFSALAGQLADSHDKAAIIRHVKSAEIAIMALGAIGLVLKSVPLLLAMLFATGLQSTIFGPIKYALLPQHLKKDEVLGGTGLVEAATYVAILVGIVVGGLVIYTDATGTLSAGWGAFLVILTAIVGRLFAGHVPPAPPETATDRLKLDWNILRSTTRLLSEFLHRPRIRLAIVCISLFWAMGTMLAAIFPPLVKNALGADPGVATLFLASFSVGVAIGSVVINRLLKGEVSARYSHWAAIGMMAFVADLVRRTSGFEGAAAGTMPVSDFLAAPSGLLILVDLFFIAALAGMYVVPLYAYLTTHVAPGETARAVAANNVVNSGLMVAASLALTASYAASITVTQSLWIVFGFGLVAAWFGWRLHRLVD